MYDSEGISRALYTMGYSSEIVGRIVRVLDGAERELAAVSVSRVDAAVMSRTPGGITMRQESSTAADAARAVLADLVDGLTDYRTAVTVFDRQSGNADDDAGTGLGSLDRGLDCLTAPAMQDVPTCGGTPGA